jgi:hypothetical protein
VQETIGKLEDLHEMACGELQECSGRYGNENDENEKSYL